MVRSRKSHAGDEENTKTSNYAKGGEAKLAPAYSGLVGHNRYVVYIHRYSSEHVCTNVLVWTFNEVYAVKWIINTIIGPTGSYEERDDFGMRRAIVTDLGIIISMHESQYDLYDIARTRLNMSALQAAWSDESLTKQIMRLKYGRAEENPVDRQLDGHADQSGGHTEADGDLGDQRRTRGKGSDNKRGRKPRGDDEFDALPKSAPIARKPKLDGLVTAGDLASALGIEARILRAALRSLSLTKPEHGWAWSAKEAEGIKVQVTAELKKGKKK